MTVSTLRELGITPGVSEAGRDLYVATVGTGPTHVWLQGRIHGNEPYGVDALLAVLKSVSQNGNPTFSKIRDELTLHVIPMYNPDGSELYIRHTVLQDGTGRPHRPQPRLGAQRVRGQGVGLLVHLLGPDEAGPGQGDQAERARQRGAARRTGHRIGLDTDPMVWHTMPHVNYIGYQTDSGVVDGIWPAYPPVQP